MKTESIVQLLLTEDEKKIGNYYTEHNMRKKDLINMTKNHIQLDIRYGFIPYGKFNVILIKINGEKRIEIKFFMTNEKYKQIPEINYYVDIDKQTERKINLLINEYNNILNSNDIFFKDKKLNKILKSKIKINVYDFIDVDNFFGDDIGNLIKQYLY